MTQINNGLFAAVIAGALSCGFISGMAVMKLTQPVTTLAAMKTPADVESCLKAAYEAGIPPDIGLRHGEVHSTDRDKGF